MSVKRVLALIALVVGLLAPTAASGLPPLGTWSLQNPVRPQTSVIDLAIGEDGVGWAAGTVPLRSAYTGATWQPVAGRATDARNGMVSVGGTSTVVMGCSYWGPRPYLEVSNDGGASWALVGTGVNFSAMDSVFANKNEGWVVGSEGVILHTVDAGQTWGPQVSGTDEWITRIDYAGGVLRAVSFSYVYTSTDLGKTWTHKSIAKSGSGLADLDFVSADVGVVVGGPGVFRTVDGGATWKPSKTDVRNANEDSMRVVFKDAFTGWIHGVSDDEWITHDGGVTWTKQYTKYAYRDRYGASIKKPGIQDSVWPQGSNIGWRIDYAGGIYFSVDGGSHWYATSAGSFTLDDLSDVSFESSTTGFAVSSRGRIWKTSDSGGSWSLCTRDPAMSIGGSQSFERVIKVPGGRGFAAGADSEGSPGVIYRTSASGGNWYATYPHANGMLHDVCSNDGVTVWAVGEKGSIVRSTNGGDSWSVKGAAAAGSANLKAIEVLPSGDGFAAGKNKMLRTTDNGATWAAVTGPPVADVTSLDAVDADTVWVGTAGGNVFRSDDAGVTWVGGDIGLPPIEEGLDPISRVRALSKTEAMAIYQNTLWATADGAVWTQRPLSSNVMLNGLAIVGDGVWVCGDDGRFYYNAHGRPEYMPPTTRIGVPLGWRRQAVNLNMYAFDEDGVDETLYRLDGAGNTLPSITPAFSTLASAGSWRRFSKPRRISKQGSTKVEYFSVDMRGNVERKKTRYILVDTSGPRIHFTAKSSYRRNSIVRPRATDAVSGMKQIMVGVSTPDRGYQKTFKGSKGVYKLSRRGTWYLDVYAWDKAGNLKRYSKRIRVY